MQSWSTATDNVAMSKYAGDVLWWLRFIREEDIRVTGSASHYDSGLFILL